MSQKEPITRAASTSLVSHSTISAGEFLLRRSSQSTTNFEKRTKNKRRRKEGYESDSDGQDSESGFPSQQEISQATHVGSRSCRTPKKRPDARVIVPGCSNSEPINPRQNCDNNDIIIHLEDEDHDRDFKNVELTDQNGLQCSVIFRDQIRASVEQVRYFYQLMPDNYESCKLQKSALKSLYHIFMLDTKRNDLKLLSSLTDEIESQTPKISCWRSSVKIFDFVQLLLEVIERRVPECGAKLAATRADWPELIWWKRKKWALKVLLKIIHSHRKGEFNQEDTLKQLGVEQTLVGLLDSCQQGSNEYCIPRVIALAMSCLAGIYNHTLPITYLLEYIIIPVACEYARIEDKLYWDEQKPKIFLKIHSPLNWLPNNTEASSASHTSKTDHKHRDIKSKIHKKSIRAALQYVAYKIVGRRCNGSLSDVSSLLRDKVFNGSTQQNIIALILSLGSTRWNQDNFDVENYWNTYQRQAINLYLASDTPLYKAHLLLWLDMSLRAPGYDLKVKLVSKDLLKICTNAMSSEYESIIVRTCAARCLMKLLEISESARNLVRSSLESCRAQFLKAIADIYESTDCDSVFNLIGSLKLLKISQPELPLTEQICEATSKLLEQLSRRVRQLLEYGQMTISRTVLDKLFGYMAKTIINFGCSGFTDNYCQNMTVITSILTESKSIVNERFACDCCYLMTRLFITNSDDETIRHSMESLVRVMAQEANSMDFHEIFWNCYAQTDKMDLNETFYGSNEKLMRIYEHCRQKIVENQNEHSIYVTHLIRYILEMWPDRLVSEEGGVVLRLFFELTIHGIRGIHSLNDKDITPSLQQCHLIMATVNALYLDHELFCEVINEEFEQNSAGIHVRSYIEQWFRLCSDPELPMYDSYASARLLTLMVSKTAHNPDFDVLVQNPEELMESTLCTVYKMGFRNYMYSMDDKRHSLLESLRLKELLPKYVAAIEPSMRDKFHCIEKSIAEKLKKEDRRKRRESN